MTETRPSTADRDVAIDRLRTAMMCIVMFGHAMLPYLTVPRRFKDPLTHVGWDWVGVFLYAFAMQAFFVTAGFAGAALFANRGAGRFWRNRWLRLGVPLLVGYLILTPLTRAATQFAQTTSLTGDLAAGWAVIASGEWIRWNKLYHLWFLASLILFSGLVLALRKTLVSLPARATAAMDAALERALQGPFAGVWLGIAVGVPMSLSYVGGTGQGTNSWMQVALFTFFALGWWLQGHREVLRGFRATVTAPLLMAVAVWPVCVWSTRDRLLAEDVSDPVMGIVAGTSNALIAALVTIAMLGWFQNRLTGPSRFGDYLGAASYWIYLVHYPVVIAAGGIAATLSVPTLAKYVVSVAIAVPVIMATYHLSRWRPTARTA